MNVAFAVDMLVVIRNPVVTSKGNRFHVDDLDDLGSKILIDGAYGLGVEQSVPARSSVNKSV